MMRRYIPLYIDVEGLKVVVFGGGSVGYRRAKLFLEGGARVVIASKDFSDEVIKLAENNSNLQLVRVDANVDSRVVEGLVREADMVVIAMNDLKASRRVATIAMEMGKLVNNATDAGMGNIIVPFHAEVNGLYVAVTSLGKTGIAARRALEKIKAVLANDTELLALYNAMSRIKVFMKKTIKDPKDRLKLYFEIEDDVEFKRLVEAGDVEGAYRRGVELIMKHASKGHHG